MTSAALRLSRVSTAIAVALALAAAPAAAAGYLKLGDIKGEVSAAGAGKKDFYKGWIELNSWSWGATRTGDPDRPLVAGRVPNPGVEREMKESGEKGGTEDINIGVGELQEATGKRQHKPMTITKEVDMATPLLAKGSVTTLVPAGTCRLGARYPTAELGTGARVYKMTDVMVAGCSPAPSGGGDRPMESMSLNYERIR